MTPVLAPYPNKAFSQNVIPHTEWQFDSNGVCSWPYRWQDLAENIREGHEEYTEPLYVILERYGPHSEGREIYEPSQNEDQNWNNWRPISQALKPVSESGGIMSLWNSLISDTEYCKDVHWLRLIEIDAVDIYLVAEQSPAGMHQLYSKHTRLSTINNTPEERLKLEQWTTEVIALRDEAMENIFGNRFGV